MARKVSQMLKTYRKYSWEQWMDGDIWEITRGKDFTVPIPQMQRNLHQAAKMKDLKVKTNSKGDKLVFQFSTPPKKIGRKIKIRKRSHGG